VADPNSNDPCALTMKTSLRENVINALNILPPKERKVLELRFGFIDEEDKTLEEVGLALEVSKERARQIEVRALKKIRRFATAKRLADYLD